MTCRADFSGPVLPSSCGTPALRKYLLTMMSVASWLHVSGTSASSILKTTEPSGFEILLERFTQATLAKGSWPALVNLRAIFIGQLPYFSGHSAQAACPCLVPLPSIHLRQRQPTLVLVLPRFVRVRLLAHLLAAEENKLRDPLVGVHPRRQRRGVRDLQRHLAAPLRLQRR